MCYLHVHFSYIIASAVDGLNEELLNHHFAADNLFNRFDGRIDRPVSGGGGFEVLAGDVQPDARHMAQPYAASNLQVIDLDPV